MPCPRYAIYYMPTSDDALYRFGAELLGYDAFTARTLDQPTDARTAFADWCELTEEPRKYGFHATMKAPMALADGVSESTLVESFEAFARTPRAIPVITPVVRIIGSFIAVVPYTNNAALDKLAADCVQSFETFRAKLTPADRARRLQQSLTPRQIAHLDRWGYPYVFEDFRFHMTLSGSLHAARCEAVLAFLHERFSKLDRAAQPIDRLALLKQQNQASRFTVLTHASLRSA